MNRARALLIILCAALFLVSCGESPLPGPDALKARRRGTLPPDPKADPPDVVAQSPTNIWFLTATVTAVSGTRASCLDWRVGTHGEEHRLYLDVSGTTVAMFAENNGFQFFPEEFHGQLVGRELKLTATPNPFGADECDGIPIDQIARVEVEGRISDDDRELTATMRERWGPLKGTPDTTVTWTWTAVRR